MCVHVSDDFSCVIASVLYSVCKPVQVLAFTPGIEMCGWPIRLRLDGALRTDGDRIGQTTSGGGRGHVVTRCDTPTPNTSVNAIVVLSIDIQQLGKFCDLFQR